MAWQLLVGGVDCTGQLRPGARFAETASSVSGTAALALNGVIPSAIVGASILLLDAGNTVWEGAVTSVNIQQHTNGQTIATLIMAQVAASAAAVGTTFGSTADNDVATLAQSLCEQIGLSWGGPAVFGEIVGGLSCTQVDDAFTVLASLMGATWSVRGGNVVFRRVTDGVTQVPATFALIPNPYSSIVLSGGVDQSSRATLQDIATTLGPPSAPTAYVSAPEIADQYTLNILGNRLASMYGTNLCGSSTFSLVDANGAPLAFNVGAFNVNVFGGAPLVATGVRAGDWLADQNGVMAIAYTVKTQLVAGFLQTTVLLGYPLLSTSQQYASSLSDSIARYPAVRVHDDYVTSGGDLTT